MFVCLIFDIRRHGRELLVALRLFFLFKKKLYFGFPSSSLLSVHAHIDKGCQHKEKHHEENPFEYINTVIAAVAGDELLRWHS